MLVSIDPGKNACGCAMFVGGKLVTAGYVILDGSCRALAQAVSTWVDVGDSLYGRKDTSDRELVIEKPQTYGGRAAKGDTNDLIDVAMVAGGIAALAISGTKVTFLYPSQWKGQIPKPKTGETYIIEARVLAALSAEERGQVGIPRAKSKAHNVYDAIGIGLKTLKRL